VKGAARRLADLKWDSDGDPMRALAKTLQGLTGKTGAHSLKTRFFTTLNALRYVSKGQDLTQARRVDHMPGN
jgi:hypothetical protein